MSNDNAWKAFFDQLSKVLELVREGKRTREFVSRVLQAIIGNDEITIVPKQASTAPSKSSRWQVWKTITHIGTGIETADDLRRMVTEAGCEIRNWAKSFFEQGAFATGRKIVLELVRVPVVELGPGNDLQPDQLYAQALEEDFGNFRTLAVNGWVLVGMALLTDPDEGGAHFVPKWINRNCTQYNTSEFPRDFMIYVRSHYWVFARQV